MPCNARAVSFCAHLVRFALITSLLASCAPVRPLHVAEPVSQSFAEGLLREWQEIAAGVSSIQGLARVKVSSPTDSLNGTQVILAEKPDRLRAETLSPFGSPLLLLAADGDKLGVLIPSRNVFYTGAATSENLGQFVHIPLRLNDLVSVLLYQPLMIEARKSEAFSLQEGGWLLIRRGASQRQEFVFDHERQLVEARFFDSNELFVKIGYGKFPEQGDRFPRLFSLELPKRDTLVKLDFSDLEVNGALRPGIFQLTPPEGTNVVYMAND